MSIKNPSFVNPYAHHPQWETGEVTRLVSRLPVDEYNFFYCISPDKGTVQTVVNHLISKLNHALTKRNITTVAEQQQFIDFILRSELILPEDRLLALAEQRIKANATGRKPVSKRATAPSTLSTSNARDDRSGVESGAGTNPGNAGRPEPLQSGGRVVGRRSKGKQVNSEG